MNIPEPVLVSGLLIVFLILDAAFLGWIERKTGMDP